ncbi:hypothetical protein [Lysobacter sp. FW306-1B-D06B]|uniref:hypothetical protein n=1 Tax=Lysobacter sp. FW306-1B-D06B TaxID=3140250 RepID=UPI003140BD11
MSDYAGTIMGTIGAVVGYMVTGTPQGATWGWTIGSGLGPCTGNSVDPWAWREHEASEVAR